MKRKTSPRRAATDSDEITPTELAKALGTTKRTVYRFYQEYRVLPKPEKAPIPGRRGGMRAFWTNRPVILDTAKQAMRLQQGGATIPAIREAIMMHVVDRDYVAPARQRTVILRDRVLASSALQRVLADELSKRLALVSADSSRVTSTAVRAAVDPEFLDSLFFLTCASFESVCVVTLPSLALAVMPTYQLPWLASTHSTRDRSVEALLASGALPVREADHARARAAELIIAFSVSGLVTMLALHMNDQELVARSGEDGAFQPAPLVWRHTKDGGAAEYRLTGPWSARWPTLEMPARRLISAEDVALFERPRLQKAATKK